jgi:nucleoside 2-deoxyribosyltransferase
MESGRRGNLMKRVYFAHPCFTEDQKKFKQAFLEAINKSLEKSGLEKEFSIIDPFDYTPNVENNPTMKRNVSRSIKEVCARILRESDVVIALVDDEDTGVAFEVGVADTALIPVVLVSHRMDLGRVNAMLLGAASAAIDNIMRPGRVDFMLDIVLGLAVMERD